MVAGKRTGIGVSPRCYLKGGRASPGGCSLGTSHCNNHTGGIGSDCSLPSCSTQKGGGGAKRKKRKHLRQIKNTFQHCHPERSMCMGHRLLINLLLGHACVGTITRTNGWRGLPRVEQGPRTTAPVLHYAGGSRGAGPLYSCRSSCGCVVPSGPVLDIVCKGKIEVVVDMCQFIVAPWKTTRGRKRGKVNTLPVYGAQLESCMVLHGVCRESLYNDNRQQHETLESYGKQHEWNKIHFSLHQNRVVVHALV